MLLRGLGGGPRQKRKPVNGLFPLARRKLIEHPADTLGIEHGFLGLDARSGLSQAEIDSSSILGMSRPDDVSATRQAIDHERHGGGSDTHVSRQHRETR